jgi:hypothetical protein
MKQDETVLKNHKENPVLVYVAPAFRRALQPQAHARLKASATGLTLGCRVDSKGGNSRRAERPPRLPN